MPIPKAASAYVPSEKLTGYLLNEQHPVGGSKAKWFLGMGYTTADPSHLAHDLLELVRASEDYTEKSSPFGVKYIVSASLTLPTGRQARVTTVWILEPTDNRPRLITAYPGDDS